MFDRERVTVTVGVLEAGGLRKCCLGLGSFHFCFQQTTITIIDHRATTPLSKNMSTVEQMEREFEAMRQKLEMARKEKEEEERAKEEARRAKEATERKAKEEAEAVAREEKAKATERMAENARRQHALAVVATAEAGACRVDRQAGNLGLILSQLCQRHFPIFTINTIIVTWLTCHYHPYHHPHSLITSCRAQTTSLFRKSKDQRQDGLHIHPNLLP
jgi:cation transport ATPase